MPHEYLNFEHFKSAQNRIIIKLFKPYELFEKPHLNMTSVSKPAPAAPQISTATRLKNFAIGGMSGMVATTFVSIPTFP